MSDLRNSAIAIWQAGVDAVQTDRLIASRVRFDTGTLIVNSSDDGTHRFDLSRFNRVCILGGGKAAGGMVPPLERLLSQHFTQADQLFGFVNIPDGSVVPTEHVRLHGCRPMGVNEPTARAVEGTTRMLELARNLTDDDLCIVLLTGGGSALLSSPAAGVTLADKLAVTRFLSAAGADIWQLNSVRRQLSHVKGGRLAAACRGGLLIGLLLSDVLGDSLETIASGPTVTVDTHIDQHQARATLEHYDPDRQQIPPSVWAAVEQSKTVPTPSAQVVNLVLANNQTATAAAANEARLQGYDVELEPLELKQKSADEQGKWFARKYLEVSNADTKRAFISGGEPTVSLASNSERGSGGRNQQLVLAALLELAQSSLPTTGTVLLSAGTDGEDGPTDAAGGIMETPQIAALGVRLEEAKTALRQNNAYPLLEQVDGLVKTGYTQTNVCDLRVILHDPGG